MALGIIVGFLLGGFLGYMLGIYVACLIFDAGNLYGLVGVFITGPSVRSAGVSRGGCSPGGGKCNRQDSGNGRPT
jgi:hypothetical protein